MFRRPRQKSELDQREAGGLWKAIALANEIGEGNERITQQVILRIHGLMLQDVEPEIAGRFRKDEDVKKLKCIEPPVGRLVADRMYQFWRDLDKKVSGLRRHVAKLSKSERVVRFDEIVDLAAWAQHALVAIHPFCNGNGRTARLLTNVLLRRYGLKPSQVRVEGEDKEVYTDALCQIDLHGDYVPLKRLIVQNIRDEYRREERVRQRKRSA